MSSKRPIPPSELVQRVCRVEPRDVAPAYERGGREGRERLERLLPADWSWDGKRVLDFGCGAGRTLRHFLDEAERAEFHGCDVHGPSVRWLEQHLTPPLHVLENEQLPPLPYADRSFDFVYALSVFTHLADSWAEWLLELRRILRPEGLLVATFMNAASWKFFERGAWDEERTGMLATRTWNAPDLGGPFVYHSEWWLREHWGRAFEVLSLERRPPVTGPGQTAGGVVLRPLSGRIEPADLKRSTDDPRELAARASAGKFPSLSTVVSFPPPELMQRVERIDKPDVPAAYEAAGRRCRKRLERLLPEGWSWDGKRVLDFGCGAGRTLRHFLDEAERAEFYGCDIDAPSIAWLEEHLSPPLHVFRSGELPSLPQPDGTFDLVYAFSVFTHLTDHWAGWLLELHRVLKPEGLLFATFLNEQLWDDFGEGAWDENRVGMNMTMSWNSWEGGGPIVFHSEWWIREHWGRAFEVLSLESIDPDEEGQQGAVLLRRRPAQVLQADLERPSDDPRELAALRLNVEQLQREAAELMGHLSRVAGAHEADVRAVAEAGAELARVSQSRSWRLTAPLRAAAATLRRRR